MGWFHSRRDKARSYYWTDDNLYHWHDCEKLLVAFNVTGRWEECEHEPRLDRMCHDCLEMDDR